MYRPIRVAQILNRMDSGGIEAVVMNYYRNIDRGQVQFDFFLSEDSNFPQKEELESCGAGIYLIPPYTEVVKYHRMLREILSNNKYNIVHCQLNTMSVFALYAARKAGVPIRICHNHSTTHWSEGKRAILKYVLRPINKLFATHWFACGQKAGVWMYGKRAYKHNLITILPNAIDTSKYAYDIHERKRLRDVWGISEKDFVLGHIGRFDHQKNHVFLLDVFEELIKIRPDSKLLLVGEGELEANIREKVKHLGIEDRVIFTGARKDANKLYNAMDVFCLPSFYEGMPLVAWEAQANGLPCVFSDKITKEVVCGDSCEFISISKPAAIWAQTLSRCSGRTENNVPDIKEKAINLQQFYLDASEQIK